MEKALRSKNTKKRVKGIDMVENDDRTIINFSKINKIYGEDGIEVHALKDIDLQIKKGEYLSVMGPSGSGKSTLMNIIGCLDVPTSGDYLFEGEDISEKNDNELALIRNKKIGFIFQTFNLLPRTDAIANVELPLIYAGISSDIRRDRAREVLESVGLGDRIHHNPNELSGGERQRVAIARALVNKPSIILADEPTGNLDTKTGTEIMKIFDDISESGNTIISVTHDPEVAKFSKRLISLRDGKIIDDKLMN